MHNPLSMPGHNLRSPFVPSSLALRPLALALLASAVLACGGSTTPGSGGGSAGGTAGGAAGGAAGGTAGGAGGGSGGGAAATSLNACSTYADHTADAHPTITYVFPAYTPPCMHISVGQMVTFAPSVAGGPDFGTHPLTPGTAPSSTGTSSASNPIVAQSSGNTISFAFPTAGTYGFYCANHQGEGMYGAIQVQ